MGDVLRIALLVYRGNPHSGGQGVYTHHLSRELAELGHHVEVFSGQPYPRLVPEVPLVEVPSLDLYRAEDPFHIPHLREFRSATDVLEFGIMCTAGSPSPARSAGGSARCSSSGATSSTSCTTTSAWATGSSACCTTASRSSRP